MAASLCAVLTRRQKEAKTKSDSGTAAQTSLDIDKNEKCYLCKSLVPFREYQCHVDSCLQLAKADQGDEPEGSERACSTLVGKRQQRLRNPKKKGHSEGRLLSFLEQSEHKTSDGEIKSSETGAFSVTFGYTGVPHIARQELRPEESDQLLCVPGGQPPLWKFMDSTGSEGLQQGEEALSCPEEGLPRPSDSSELFLLHVFLNVATTVKHTDDFSAKLMPKACSDLLLQTVLLCPTDSHSRASEVQHCLQQFKVTVAQLQQIQASLLGSMEQALRGQASPVPAVRMLPTYVGSTPHGTEQGDFVVLELGATGASLRVLWVTLTGIEGHRVESRSQEFVIPQDVMLGAGQQSRRGSNLIKDCPCGGGVRGQLWEH
ncbi:hypothetical protein P7K49_005391 [Saguinus oedipus]|uniref:hexokinase n=1 Tax=Saguinus oedipus TaxID=9490 RepID=A0ABQ9WA39_SAGOE|nr:hypothetical protein P7K49_005391 [Saguinus oedipus]